MKKIIVTGGLGYIGSHTAVELSEKFQVVIVDDLSNSSADNTKSKEELKWSPKYSLDDAILSAWKWEKKIRNI